jgi:predicted acetyltransferase
LADEDPESQPVKEKLINLDAYISHARGSRVNDHHISIGSVPFSEYWLMAGNHYLGMIQIRHQPNGQYPGFESHIYYHIIPSERGKGFGTKLLLLGLKKARKLGLSEVLLTTEASNHRSRRIIETCGGVFLKESKVLAPKTLLLQYRIDLARTSHDCGADDHCPS